MNRIQLRPRHPVHCVAVSPDGDLLAVYQPHVGVSLVPPGGDAPTHTFPLRGNPVFRQLLFHPAGDRLLGRTAGGVFVADWRGRPVAGSVRAYEVRDLAFADSAESADLVYTFGVRRHRFDHLLVYPSSVHPGWPPVTAPRVAHRGLSPDGRYVIADADPGCATVRLAVYSFPELRKVGTLVTAFPRARFGYQSPLIAAAFAPAGDRVALASADGIDVFAWPPPPPPATPAMTVTVLPPEPAWKSRLRRLARTAVEAVLGPAARGRGSHRHARRSPLPELSPAARIPVAPTGGRGPLHPPFAFTPCGGRLLVRGRADRIELWDAAAGVRMAEWDWGLSAVRSIAVAGTGLVAAAGGRRGKVVAWDLA